MRVDEFLDDFHTSYSKSTHPTAYTAQQLAASEHVSVYNVVKPVVLKAAAEAKKAHRLKVKRGDVLALLDELNQQAGLHLAEQWTLPTPVAGSMRYDPEVDNGAENLNGARIAYLGNRLATLHLGPHKQDTSEPWDPKLSQALELGPDAVKDLLEMGDTISEMVASVSPDS